MIHDGLCGINADKSTQDKLEQDKRQKIQLPKESWENLKRESGSGADLTQRNLTIL